MNQQIPWLASLTGEALAALRPLPGRYGVALLPAPCPSPRPAPTEGAPQHLNRAWLVLPDGNAFA